MTPCSWFAKSRVQFKIQTLFLFLITVFGTSCNYIPCANSAKDWVHIAPSALQEFQAIEIELGANPEFVDAFANDGDLFLRTLDTSAYMSFNVPLLMNWYRNGGGFISIEPGHKYICYRDRERGAYTSGAYLEQGVSRRKYTLVAQVVETMTLENGWKAEVLTCTGCNQ